MKKKKKESKSYILLYVAQYFFKVKKSIILKYRVYLRLYFIKIKSVWLTLIRKNNFQLKKNLFHEYRNYLVGEK